MSKDPKNNVLRIRLTEEDRKCLDAEAERQGYSTTSSSGTSTWARAQLLALAAKSSG